MWANSGLFSTLLLQSFFTKLNYFRYVDDELGMSTSCCLGLSSHPGLTQVPKGVQGRFAPMSVGYLKAGVVTMAATAVDTMSS